MQAAAVRQHFLPRVSLVFIGALLAGNAMAANKVRCDKGAEVPAEQPVLVLKNVDHVPPLEALNLDETLNIEEATGETSGPVAALAPEIESMFEQIFEEQPEDETSPGSPVADSVENAPADSPLSDAGLEVNPELLRIQDQMFRQDI